MLCLSVKTVFEPCLTFMKFASQLFSGADESLKDETRLLLLGDGSLVTLHTHCVHPYIYLYIWYLVFITEGFFGVAIESWPE